MFVLGIAWAFGKASVFKYIADDYPNNIGAISGIVGLAGGLGGFVLPILFGALVDLTGVRSSAFMLMYGVVWVSLIWMYFTEVRRTEVMGTARRCPSPDPACPSEEEHDRRNDRSLRHGRVLTIWTPEDKAFWEREGKPIATLQPVDLRSCAVPGLRGLEVWSVVARRTCRRSASSTPPTSCSGWPRCRRCRARRCASSIPSWCRSSAAGAGPRSPPRRC